MRVTSEQIAEMEFAERLAKIAGVLMREGRRNGLSVTKKSDGTDVSDVDKDINQMVIDEVARTRPWHAVIGEEQSSPGSSSKKWVVDPIDGTRDYTLGGDASVFALALCNGSELELAVVLNPFRNERFTAIKGHGARLNNRRISVNKKAAVYDYSYWPGGVVDPRVLIDTMGERIGNGSAIYQNCMVAAGRSALSVFPGRAIHDIAAGALIVAEAGGTVTDVLGNPHDFSQLTLPGAVMSNGVRHDEIITALHAA